MIFQNPLGRADSMKSKIKDKINPINRILISFVLLILAGGVLLYAPVSNYSGISFVDAVFTSTSAVCVTGLVVLDTAKDFTPLGRGVILLLIQLGGFGIMTLSLGLFTMLGGSLSIQWRYAFEGMYSDIKRLPIKNILTYVIKYTMILELIFAAVLFTQFIQDHRFLKAVEHSIFHSISAFCNAGFSTFSDNLVPYRGNVAVNLTICTAIICGGIGFLVLNEISSLVKKGRRRGYFRQLTIHSRIVLISTGVLIFWGMGLFYFLEYQGILKGMTLTEQLLTSLFQSVTCRTAGFNTVDIGLLKEPTLYLQVFLMFVGGSPGSIAGGIKTTTMTVIVLLLITKFRGREQVVVWKRALNRDDVDRSATLVVVVFLFLSFVTFILLSLTSGRVGFNFLTVLYEIVSAFGTVGLSTGITPKFTDLEKIIVSLVMLIGRLGPLTLILALTINRKKVFLEYPEENIMIG